MRFDTADHTVHGEEEPGSKRGQADDPLVEGLVESDVPPPALDTTATLSPGGAAYVPQRRSDGAGRAFMANAL
ncbi:hypothetical protein ACH4CC_17085 [Streptomyces lydicus]|uniref:hypothetical protein n=1 Tax=Streptomyces lydicus TaxID=47763 RepID=UPI003787E3D9